MRWLLDACYLVLAVVGSPWWLSRMIATGKIRTDWRGRFGRVPPLRGDRTRPTILIHAVSVGEVNACRSLIPLLRADATQPNIVIAATTDTGVERARALFGGDSDIIRFPLDFSFSVGRMLRAVRPDVVVLLELEVWPNLVGASARRGIPVCVVNGRMSARSMRRYRVIRPLLRKTFARLAMVGAQTETYASRFIEMGVPGDRVRITDTMKWDAAAIVDTVDGADTLAMEMGIDRSRPLVVAGSTEPSEHALMRDTTPPGVQLLCAPRRPEWFEAAANDLPGCVRRTRPGRGSASGRFLLDTIGELTKAYALADIVVIGRSFGELHGSDMMEPVALGKATIVGPRVADFQDTMDALLEARGIVQTDRDGLARAIGELLDNPARRAELARRGREVVRAHQGASARHAAMILALLNRLPAR